MAGSPKRLSDQELKNELAAVDADIERLGGNGHVSQYPHLVESRRRRKVKLEKELRQRTGTRSQGKTPQLAGAAS